MIGTYMAIARYLDPKSDSAFKRIFGSEKNKDILIEFLNDILELNGDERVADVDFINTHLLPEYNLHKLSAVDVICRDTKGRRFILEMQVSKTDCFMQRSQFYASRAYVQQLRVGASYGDLEKVIFLGILDFIEFPDIDRFHTKHIVIESLSGHSYLDGVAYHFIELEKFNNTDVSEMTTKDKWIYFLKHAEGGSIDEAISEATTPIRRAYAELYSYHWTEEEIIRYESEMKANMDAEAMLAHSLNKGRKEGRKEGLEEGRAEGLQEGRQEAIKELAINLLAANVDIATISKSTGLTGDELISIKRQL